MNEFVNAIGDTDVDEDEDEFEEKPSGEPIIINGLVDIGDINMSSIY